MDTESGATTNRSENGSNETGTDERHANERTDDSDSIPGFTTGTGLLGGALSLEWLRRRAVTDEPDE
ncbi:hypothetical protein [Halostagnicola kamekurae]|uniref:Uncharacterized protein n=1 Tax=Halostagnicola kamekurae TaxID=619731 RepID=A0A1I6TTR4_9EURY|nr:hypothetical protein [Halostagnicola kamekurae]SFS92612.1 hypothetical protein SAMN04488556_3428 [Halostagnicola kamekurae]